MQSQLGNVFNLTVYDTLEQCTVVFIIFLLTFESNYYNAVTWYTFTASFIEEIPDPWPMHLSIIVAALSPTLSVYSILGNVFAVVYTLYRQQTATFRKLQAKSSARTLGP